MDDTVYKDDDLIYVDPKSRTIVGRVEWLPSGKAKSMPMKEDEEVEGDDGKRRRRRRYYPWGTYRTMKKVYKLGERGPLVENTKTLDEVIEKALKEPFWD